MKSYNPSRNWFGLFPLRSPLLRESCLLSLPLGTKMFQFPRSTSHILISSYMSDILKCRVPPFGYLRITAYLQLPKAFRCLFRPSSALGAKASTVRPSLLNRNEFVREYLYSIARVLLNFSFSVSTLEIISLNIICCFYLVFNVLMSDNTQN